MESPKNINSRYENMIRVMNHANQSLEAWRREMKETGYEVKTTFWADFTIAEAFGDGVDAVKDTYRRAFKDWKSDREYITEFVMVLNHKIWQHYHLGHDILARTYDELWRQADEWCCDNLKGEDLDYYCDTTD